MTTIGVLLGMWLVFSLIVQVVCDATGARS